MTKQYRLTARAEFHGEIRDPGYVFTLGKDELGPHRTVVASNHGAQITDHMGDAKQDLKDVPLYEEVKEEETAHEEEQKEPTAEELKADLDAAAGKIASLERELADKHKELAVANETIKAINAAITTA